MDKFEASNGGTVEVLANGRMTVTDKTVVRLSENAERTGRTAYLDAEMVPTLREFFRAERDEELGRWRWPENPEYIVLGEKTTGVIGVGGDFSYRSVVVVHEPSMRILWRPDRDPASLGGRKEPVVYNGDQAFADAARAYFEAHPERKPWEDAKHEEVWLLTVNGDTGPFLADQNADSPIATFVAANGTRIPRFDREQIMAGRRIWPEEA